MTEPFGQPPQICPLTKVPAKVRHSQEGALVVESPTCGTYTVERLALPGESDPGYARLYVLAALARRESDNGRRLKITRSNMKALLESVVPPKDPFDLIDNLLLLARDRLKDRDFSSRVPLSYDDDYPAVFARNPRELGAAVMQASEEGYIGTAMAGGAFDLTAEGWRRANELRNVQEVSNQAFVAMWFTPDLDPAWDAGFKPALKELGFDPIRIDRKEFNNKIDDEIVADIRRSGLLVADFTGHRGGVYFEAGFAMGLGIPVIWTCRQDEIDKAHFDTRQYNHITWDAPDELQRKLVARIEATNPGRVRTQR